MTTLERRVSVEEAGQALGVSPSTVWRMIRRGDLPSVLPRLQVYSAGNDGQDAQYQATQTGYFSLTNQIKNGIVVGNYDRLMSRTFEGTSLGPAYDGRLKPDKYKRKSIP